MKHCITYRIKCKNLAVACKMAEKQLKADGYNLKDWTIYDHSQKSSYYSVEFIRISKLVGYNSSVEKAINSIPKQYTGVVVIK